MNEQLTALFDAIEKDAEDIGERGMQKLHELKSLALGLAQDAKNGVDVSNELAVVTTLAQEVSRTANIEIKSSLSKHADVFFAIVKGLLL